ncbi:unnamed protein product [Macrosiphum euphorbiae]|uniref:Uncharacterized protein n=1 Tax=Macrosiphum euphorbiae TaxID=13131 RepID=A0AAV0VZZ7_9HEMI|nr:unnamed protein product [Macrosiphum euphorbiae]
MDLLTFKSQKSDNGGPRKQTTVQRPAEAVCLGQLIREFVPIIAHLSRTRSSSASDDYQLSFISSVYYCCYYSGGNAHSEKYAVSPWPASNITSKVRLVPFSVLLGRFLAVIVGGTACGYSHETLSCTPTRSAFLTTDQGSAVVGSG